MLSWKKSLFSLTHLQFSQLSYHGTHRTAQGFVIYAPFSYCQIWKIILTCSLYCQNGCWGFQSTEDGASPCCPLKALWSWLRFPLLFQLPFTLPVRGVWPWEVDRGRQSFTAGLSEWFLRYIHDLDTDSYLHQIIDLYQGDSRNSWLEPALLNLHGKNGLIMMTCGMAMTTTSHFFHTVSLIEWYAPMILQKYSCVNYLYMQWLIWLCC